MALAPTGPRADELDGIRGWAALCVVTYHMLWETFGLVAPELKNPLSGFFLDGSLAISVFFVLSGEALSASYFSGHRRFFTLGSAVKRYLRLTIPIMAACVLTFLVHWAGLAYNIAAGTAVLRPDWLGSWLTFAPDGLQAIRYALFEVYTRHEPQVALVPFLWTMKIELAGSFLVFLVLNAYRHLPYRWAAIGALFVLLYSFELTRHLTGFLAGLAFSRLRQDGYFEAMRQKPGVNLLSLAAVLAIAAAIGLSNWYEIQDEAWKPLFAMALLFGVYCSRLLHQVFRSGLSRFLGRISFPLYLVQFPVIVSLTSYLILLVDERFEINLASALLIAALSVAATIIVAWMFSPVEVFARRVGSSGRAKRRREPAE